MLLARQTESHSVSTATLFAVKEMGVGRMAAEAGPLLSFSLPLEPTHLPASSGFQLSSGNWHALIILVDPDSHPCSYEVDPGVK